MKIDNISNYFKGWVVGDFDPSILRTKDFEVAYKEYSVNDYEPKHYHLKATEITIIVEGKVEMNKKQYEKGDIIIIDKGESTDFRALEKAATVVIKYPSVSDDKFLCND